MSRCRVFIAIALAAFACQGGPAPSDATPGPAQAAKASTPRAAPNPAKPAAAPPTAPTEAPVLAPRNRHGELVHEATSDYGRMSVRKKGNRIALYFVRKPAREVLQTRMDLDAPQDLVTPYARAMMVAMLGAAGAERVLIVGLGGGSMVRALQHHRPSTRIDAVEIDAEVVRIAREWFGVKPSPTTHIATRDAFQYLADQAGPWDVIFMDAFLQPSEKTDSTGRPLHLSTASFYRDVRKKLAPGGVLTINLNRGPSTRKDLETLSEAFPHVQTIRRGGNVLVLAGAEPLPAPAELLARGRKRLPQAMATWELEKAVSDLTPAG